LDARTSSFQRDHQRRWLLGAIAQPRSSLVSKVALTILFVGIGLALLFAATGALFLRDNEIKRQLQLTAELLTTVESTVRIACFTGDKALAREVAEGLMTNHSVAGIRISAGEQVLAETHRRTSAATSAPEHMVRRAVASPFDANSVVGDIVLIADSDVIRTDAAEHSGFFACILLLEVLAVTLAVAFVIFRTVVRPIKVLASDLQRIRATADQRLPMPKGHESNEIGQLTKVFNAMIGHIGKLLTQEQSMREQMAHSERRFRTLAENSPDIIVRHDLHHRLVFANPAYARETGLPLDLALSGVLDEQSTWRPAIPIEQYRARLRRVVETGAPDCLLWEWTTASGNAVCHEMHVVAEYDADGNAVGTLAIGRNVTDRREAERQLVHQATHDALTGLPNRALLKDRLQQGIAQSRRDGRNVALLFIDLDHFKSINDTLGHDTGDELLKLLAGRMQSVLRVGDTVARLGGDEFVVLIQDGIARHQLDRVAQKIFHTIATPCEISGHQIYPGASMGIAVYPQDGADADTLMRSADTAMYVAKDRGRNNCRFYSAEMNNDLREWLQMSNDLRRALENREFELHYQPKADVATGAFAGMEALIRWRHPDLGMVSPGRFIPVAEENGLIGAIGHWVLDEACRQMRAWLNAGLEPIRVAVNLSAVQCQGDELLRHVRTALAGHRLEGRRLELEITESIVMAHAEESIRSFWALREMGVRVAVDDFGTGYSSLSYLKRLPVDNLKIDKSFVDDIDVDPNDVEIIRAIIAMAHTLGMRTIAEGVETQSQLECLRQAGCDELQGYHYCKPLPAAEVTALIRNGNWCRLQEVESASEEAPKTI
jgi:diguanylate cyclase (GGDEF)-like protein/PAS domain S-box-containing protein